MLNGRTQNSEQRDFPMHHTWSEVMYEECLISESAGNKVVQTPQQCGHEYFVTANVIMNITIRNSLILYLLLVTHILESASLLVTV